MNPNIQAMADELAVSADSIESLVQYIAEAAKKPAGRKALAADPEGFIRAGTEAWHRNWAKFYTEILENKTPMAIQYRREIAEQTYNSFQSTNDRPKA